MKVEDYKMCEKKIREGKVKSPPSKTKKRSSKKKIKLKFCDTCNQDILSNEERDAYMFKNTYHQLRAKEYCEKHISSYTNHKCKPHWCGDCGYLINYEIELFTK